jgi:hypothetical protein
MAEMFVNLPLILNTVHDNYTFKSHDFKLGPMGLTQVKKISSRYLGKALATRVAFSGLGNQKFQKVTSVPV